MPLDVEAIVQEELLAGRMTVAEGADVIGQHVLFEMNRAGLEAEHPGKWVGFVAGMLLVSDSNGDLFDQAQTLAPESMLYFEQLPSFEGE
ncbi:hypothetical protein AB0M39_26605 [Streptomyces sp. NPDC051907]|uniref:hypothetical protein n=1 Tax=Streptomyces sp. NPDC051907 TaxID=3155284 RepID=UPI00343DF5EC